MSGTMYNCRVAVRWVDEATVQAPGPGKPGTCVCLGKILATSISQFLSLAHARPVKCASRVLDLPSILSSALARSTQRGQAKGCGQGGVSHSSGGVHYSLPSLGRHGSNPGFPLHPWAKHSTEGSSPGCQRRPNTS